MKFFRDLLSDSNRASTKRFIGILSLIMFIAYGVRGLFMPFNLQFAIFYVSLCSVTLWIAFKFMTSEKALKYNVLGKLAKFGLKDAVDDIIDKENELDDAVQPTKVNSDMDKPLNS